MTCIICNKEHRCRCCGYWFATMSEWDGDDRKDCDLCWECYHSIQSYHSNK